jgi:cell fate (sporulation/competence/biofilm development) regulator YlbF (YheA/YmcA/DUF963 family)
MQTILNPTMHDAAEALMINLRTSEVFIRYQQAQNHLREDHQANILLKQLNQAQVDLRKQQANGGVTQAEIDALRTLQEQVQQNKIIMTYAQSQQEAIKLLREIDNEISQLLGINFASFANHATC